MCVCVCVEAVKQDCVYSSKARLAVCVCDESQPDTAGGLITLPESVCVCVRVCVHGCVCLYVWVCVCIACKPEICTHILVLS